MKSGNNLGYFMPVFFYLCFQSLKETSQKVLQKKASVFRLNEVLRLFNTQTGLCMLQSGRSEWHSWRCRHNLTHTAHHFNLSRGIFIGLLNITQNHSVSLHEYSLSDLLCLALGPGFNCHCIRLLCMYVCVCVCVFTCASA